ncbi:CBS domain-containing protein [Desulfurivibrio sp. C05AmB]|jgi:tRNA nucleotidyltransferase (CCA-adding enzyme)|uniref:CBS domain-containing protein n=1 Tax=Desulfurivibrio sp. C05AmB TaxID=3374371 RepID=UPI00376ED916
MDLITTHINADFDALASMVAAKKLYPEAILAFAGAQEKNLRDFFSQSVEYLYDFQRLKNIPFKEVKRLIVVDTRQASRLGTIAECLANPGLEIHIYDHHPANPGDLRGNVEHIRPVGSTVTIFVDLFRSREVTLSPQEATLLAMGIYEDTGSFHFDTTTPEDLQAAAWLLERGANLHAITQFIAQELTSTEVTLLGELIRSATTYTIQGLDITVAKLTIDSYFDGFAMVVRRFMVMENLNTLFALARMGERTYLIARSRIPEVNAGEIVREFGGGGHASAASATIKDLTMIEAEEKLIQVLHKQIRPQRLAGDLMSAPVISGRPNITIHQAEELLNRYNITVLPVVDENHRVIGLISRRVAGKAAQLGLQEQPVSDYMSTEFATLTPMATMGDIQELIIEHRQRIIPVVDGRNGELQGVITRTDLLNLLVNDPSRLPRNLYSEQLPSSERQRNLQNLMVERLGRRIVVLLRTIGEVAEARKYHAFAVGGFVRDLLLHEKNLDIDVVIEGDGIRFAKDLAARLGGEVRVHSKFKTAMVRLPDGLKVDVATARLEYYDYPAAMPTVELSSLKLDLYRRDFTINAMAVHLNPENFGLLVDFFNSQNDLKDKKIRVLHNLSFVEDPTRIFRAIRFEQRMGFAIGRHTERLIKNAVRMNLFDRFFGYRFFGELQLMLNEDNPLPAIRRLAELGLLPFLHPKLRMDARLENILSEAQAGLAWYHLLYLDKPCRPWLVYLLALTATLKGEEVKTFCARFEVPVRIRQALLREKWAAQQAATSLRRHAPTSNSGIYHLLADLGPEGLLYLMAIIRKKAAKKSISLYVTELIDVRPEISGHDLKNMGYQPGPRFREIFDQLLDARLDGKLRNRKQELAYVRRHFPLTAGSPPDSAESGPAPPPGNCRPGSPEPGTKP